MAKEVSKKIAHSLKNKWRSEDVKFEENFDFATLSLPESILKGLKRAGFEKPSPVQVKAIPLARCGVDVIVQAKSGTGKTCVFAVIALDMVCSMDFNANLQVLVLSPTREIADQSCSVIRSIGKYIPNFQCHTFIGGTSVTEDFEKLNSCQVAVGTTGRIKHLMTSKALMTGCIRLLVLDEADKLMQGSFIEDIHWIYNHMPLRKQMLALSATYTSDLINELEKFMAAPTMVTVSGDELALKGLVQFYCLIPYHAMSNVVIDSKKVQLFKILNEMSFSQCLIFCNAIVRVDALYDWLHEEGLPVAKISSSDDQESRLNTIQQLKQYDCRILVTSDLTSRGIDAKHVDLVINFDLCTDVETYLHRVGRAGRFGSKAMSITLITAGRDELRLGEFEQEGGFEAYPLPETLPEGLLSMPIEDVCSLVAGSYKKSLEELQSGFAGITKKKKEMADGEIESSEKAKENEIADVGVTVTCSKEEADQKLETPDLSEDQKLNNEECLKILSLDSLVDNSADHAISVGSHRDTDDLNVHVDEKDIHLKVTTEVLNVPTNSIEFENAENDSIHFGCEENMMENAETFVEASCLPITEYVGHIESQLHVAADTLAEELGPVVDNCASVKEEVNSPNLVEGDVLEDSMVANAAGEIPVKLADDAVGDVENSKGMKNQLVMLDESSFEEAHQGIVDVNIPCVTTNAADSIKTDTGSEKCLDSSQQLKKFLLYCCSNDDCGCADSKPSDYPVSAMLSCPTNADVGNWEKRFEKLIQTMKTESADDGLSFEHSSYQNKEFSDVIFNANQDYLHNSKNLFFTRIKNALEEIEIQKAKILVEQKVVGIPSLRIAKKSKKKSNKDKKMKGKIAGVKDVSICEFPNVVNPDVLGSAEYLKSECASDAGKENSFDDIAKSRVPELQIEHEVPNSCDFDDTNKCDIKDTSNYDSNDTNNYDSKDTNNDDSKDANNCDIEDNNNYTIGNTNNEVQSKCQLSDECSTTVLHSPPAENKDHVTYGSIVAKGKCNENLQTKYTENMSISTEELSEHQNKRLSEDKASIDLEHQDPFHSGSNQILQKIVAASSPCLKAFQLHAKRGLHDKGHRYVKPTHEPLQNPSNFCHDSTAAAVCCHNSLQPVDMLTGPLNCCFGKHCHLHAKGESLHYQLLEAMKHE